MNEPYVKPYVDEGRKYLDEVEYLVSPIVRRRGDAQDPVEKQYLPDGTEIPANPGSQQIPPDFRRDRTNLDNDYVHPPIDLRLWANQLSRNTRLNRGIRIIARNTVGLGWHIVPASKINEETPQEELDAIERERQIAEDFFENINPTKPYQSLAECEVIDEEATGNGYFEVTRTGAGKVEYLYHVPSVTMRVLRFQRGFVQIRDGTKKYFKNFGEPRAMNAKNGKFAGEDGFLESGATVLPANQRATEIIHFPLYSPLSDTYGLPRFIPASAAIAGNFYAGRRNVAFFQNDAVPRMAVMVSGGTLDKDSKNAVANLFQEGQGADQAHRILVLEAQSEGTGVDGDKNNIKIELKPLTVDTTEDGSFLNYRRVNDEEIREALGLSEVYFKSEKLTKASAVVAKATTDEQEFEPARILKETVINKLLVQGPNGLGLKRVRFKLARPTTTDPLEAAQVHKIYSDIGAMSTNEIRADLGKEPMPQTEEWAKAPLPVAMLALEGKIRNGSAFATPDPDAAAAAQENPPAEPDLNTDSNTDGEGNAGADPEPTQRVHPVDEIVLKASSRIRELPETIRSRKSAEEE